MLDNKDRYFVKCLVVILISVSVQSIGLGQAPSSLRFEEIIRDFPREEKNLRKWDAPVIADLDQDGYPDLLLNDHGLGIRVCWNNQGKFAPPFDIIMGDIHGITVGDFDLDGLLEIVMSRGGGSGSNARNSKIFRVDKQRNVIPLPDFKEPLALMRGRTVKFLDADNDGDLDLLNFAFPDKLKRGKSENYVYENNGEGQLVLSNVLPPSQGDGQKTLLTDFNSDGIFDLILYGHGPIQAFQGQAGTDYQEVSDHVFPSALNNVTSVVEIDYDNDGDFDLFLTRGKPFEKGETFYDAENKTWGFYTSRGEFEFEDLPVGDILQMENFQSQWPYNAAYYLGETGYPYEFPGETHSGKNIRLVNSNVLGFPDQPTEKGFYIGYIGNQKWRLLSDMWSPSTGVIHGVKDYPKYDHQPGLKDILLENINGKFVEREKLLKLDDPEHTVSAAVADFDNNGYQDLVVIKRGNLIHSNEAKILLNFGEKGFLPLDHHQVSSPELGAIGLAVETLDYDEDGKMDIILGNERGKWHLFKNKFDELGSTNYLKVAINNSPSGKATALGALVEIKGCGFTQVKRVGTTGAAYSSSLEQIIHFGIGDCAGPIKIGIEWTNGESLKKTASSFNKKIVLGKVK